MYQTLLALAALAGGAAQAVATPVPAPLVAINAEKATGFRDLAECRKAIGAESRQETSSRFVGTLVNRAYGNRTRCEMVGGEPLVVVYLRGS